MKNLSSLYLLIFVTIISSCSLKKLTYVPVNQELFTQILVLDKKLFDAFNSNDFDTVKSMHAPELEFFHDEAGLMTFEQHTGGIKRILKNDTKVRRELIEESSEVYPIRNYGAIQIGEHRFYNKQIGGAEKLMGTYKFTHIWHKKEEGWQITRAISYGH